MYSKSKMSPNHSIRNCKLWALIWFPACLSFGDWLSTLTAHLTVKFVKPCLRPISPLLAPTVPTDTRGWVPPLGSAGAGCGLQHWSGPTLSRVTPHNLSCDRHQEPLLWALAAIHADRTVWNSCDFGGYCWNDWWVILSALLIMHWFRLLILNWKGLWKLKAGINYTTLVLSFALIYSLDESTLVAESRSQSADFLAAEVDSLWLDTDFFSFRFSFHPSEDITHIWYFELILEHVVFIFHASPRNESLLFSKWFARLVVR